MTATKQTLQTSMVDNGECWKYQQDITSSYGNIFKADMPNNGNNKRKILNFISKPT